MMEVVAAIVAWAVLMFVVGRVSARRSTPRVEPPLRRDFRSLPTEYVRADGARVIPSINQPCFTRPGKIIHADGRVEEFPDLRIGQRVRTQFTADGVVVAEVE